MSNNKSLQVMNHLISLQCDLTEIVCIQIFGKKQMGIHLYQKFLQSKGNIINFYSCLDANNKKYLADYIEALIVSGRISKNN